MSDFDRDADRQEEREDRKHGAALILQGLDSLKRNVCCVFLDDSDEILHGRLEGVLAETDALILRDLTPGKQALRCKIMVPYEKVQHMCFSESDTNCKRCAAWKEIEEMGKDDKEKEPEK